MNNFKIGDRIVLTKDITSEILEGSVGTIDILLNEGACVYFDNRPNTVYVHESEMELESERKIILEKTPNEMFNLGDKVILVDRPNYPEYPPLGTEGVVTPDIYHHETIIDIDTGKLIYVNVLFTGYDSALLMLPEEIMLSSGNTSPSEEVKLVEKAKCEDCRCDGPCGPKVEEKDMRTEEFYFNYYSRETNNSFELKTTFSSKWNREDILEKFNIFLDSVVRAR